MLDDSGRLSVKPVKNGTLKIYPGYPHGMLTIHVSSCPLIGLSSDGGSADIEWCYGESPLITHRGLFPSSPKMSVFKGKACAFGCLEVRIEEEHHKLEFAKLAFCSGTGSSAVSES